MTPDGRVFDSSLAKGYPYQIRVGAEQVRGLGVAGVSGLGCWRRPGWLPADPAA